MQSHHGFSVNLYLNGAKQCKTGETKGPAIHVTKLSPAELSNEGNRSMAQQRSGPLKNLLCTWRRYHQQILIGLDCCHIFTHYSWWHTIGIPPVTKKPLSPNPLFSVCKNPCPFGLCVWSWVQTGASWKHLSWIRILACFAGPLAQSRYLLWW